MSSLTYFHDLDTFCRQMDNLGRERTPFLFGLNYEMTELFISLYPFDSKELHVEIKDVIRTAEFQQRKLTDRVSFEVQPHSLEEYRLKFNQIHAGLRRGDSFLANLTLKTPIFTNLSLEEIFQRSEAPYKICLPGRFVCFSPERFVRIIDGEIYSNPMKGTISASIPDAEEKILSDFKEKAEHCTIIDLIRNDLSMIAENVSVKRFRYVDRIRTHRGEDILQVSSEIGGKLSPDYLENIGSTFLQLLPAGSICGAPKRATLDLIHSAEQDDRGYYTGVFGYFDGKNLDSAVMIRFIEEENGQKYFRSGGDITAYSSCENEYDEILKKIYLPFV